MMKFIVTLVQNNKDDHDVFWASNRHVAITYAKDMATSTGNTFVVTNAKGKVIFNTAAKRKEIK